MEPMQPHQVISTGQQRASLFTGYLSHGRDQSSRQTRAWAGRARHGVHRMRHRVAGGESRVRTLAGEELNTLRAVLPAQFH